MLTSFTWWMEPFPNSRGTRFNPLCLTAGIAPHARGYRGSSKNIKPPGLWIWFFLGQALYSDQKYEFWTKKSKFLFRASRRKHAIMHWMYTKLHSFSKIILHLYTKIIHFEVVFYHHHQGFKSYLILDLGFRTQHDPHPSTDHNHRWGLSSA